MAEKFQNFHNLSLYFGVSLVLFGLFFQAARILGLDKDIGTIEVGKWANFVILDKNPLKVNPLDIKDIRIKGTVYKGQGFF